MKCRHCLVDFFPNLKHHSLQGEDDPDGVWGIEWAKCPSCGKLNIDLILFSKFYRPTQGEIPGLEISRKSINPIGINRKPCPIEVPNDISEDYKEACLVLPNSLIASAALSRRCLQNLLRNAAGVKPSDLFSEIQQVIDNGKLPSYLAEIIDAVRIVGNFASHPIKSKNTGEIVPVEPAEAELNLEVLEGLFDFYYVLPAKNAVRKAAIDAKLKDAGKSALK